MQERPRIPLVLSRLDRAVELTALLVLLALWAGTILIYGRLPEEIPTHFNASGTPDAWGSKREIWMLPLVATVIYIGMTWINRYPHRYNYLRQVTPENAHRLYASATRMIRVLKLVVVLIFSAIVYFTYRTSLANGAGLGGWFLPAAIALILLPTFLSVLLPSRKPEMRTE